MRTSMMVAAVVGAALTAGVIGGAVGTRLGDARGAAAQGSAVTASSVTTQELRLVDAQGKVRLRAGIAADNGVFLNLRGPDESPQIILGSLASGEPAIQLLDGAGVVRASLDLEQNASSLLIYDGQGRARIFVGQAQSDGDPVIQIRRTDRSNIFSAP